MQFTKVYKRYYENIPLESVLKLADISFFALILDLVIEDTSKDILIECI